MDRVSKNLPGSYQAQVSVLEWVFQRLTFPDWILPTFQEEVFLANSFEALQEPRKTRSQKLISLISHKLD